jgi:hypothetical protein
LSLFKLASLKCSGGAVRSTMATAAIPGFKLPDPTLISLGRAIRRSIVETDEVPVPAATAQLPLRLADTARRTHPAKEALCAAVEDERTTLSGSNPGFEFGAPAIEHGLVAFVDAGTKQHRVGGLTEPFEGQRHAGEDQRSEPGAEALQASRVVVTPLRQQRATGDTSSRSRRPDRRQ